RFADNSRRISIFLFLKSGPVHTPYPPPPEGESRPSRSIVELAGETRKGFVRRCPAIQPLLHGSCFYCLRLPASVVVRHRISVKSHSSRERRRRCRQAENQR